MSCKTPPCILQRYLIPVLSGDSPGRLFRFERPILASSCLFKRCRQWSERVCS